MSTFGGSCPRCGPWLGTSHVCLPPAVFYATTANLGSELVAMTEMSDHCEEELRAVTARLAAAEKVVEAAWGVVSLKHGSIPLLKKRVLEYDAFTQSAREDHP